ncbi:MAG TPA: signal peptidase II [Propionibacteriaceae bacterium]|nr:signal peptidase II [Propionibacteriaceae bacterium]
MQAARGTALSPSPARLRLIIAGIAIPGYLLDLATKRWALATLDPTEPPSFLGGLLKFRLVFNPGAAFSLGTGATVVLSVFALTAFLVLIFVVVPRVRRAVTAVATGMLLAGVSGNLTDRLFRAPGPFRGHVIDFIALPHFAIFNVADMFITFTAVLLVWLAFKDPQRGEASGVLSEQDAPEAEADA